MAIMLLVGGVAPKFYFGVKNMKCIQKTPFASSNGVYVPCGQCMPCRLNRKNEWVSRLLLEWFTWNKGVFITLTYAPENLPDKQYFKGGSLSKPDFQKFMKRFRFHYGSSDVRYFGVGEYGSQTQRSHYHVLLFNVEPDLAEIALTKSWTLGHFRVDELNIHRIKYTCGYTLKKMTSLKDFPDGRSPEFSLMSRKPALGWYAIPKFAELLRKAHLTPAFALSMEQTWMYENEGFSVTPWYGGYFIDKDFNIEFPLHENYKPSPGAHYHQLDASMMRRLYKYMFPLSEVYLDARSTLLTPKAFKVRRNRLTDTSKIGNIRFEESIDYEKAKKKSEKFQRKAEQSRYL